MSGFYKMDPAAWDFGTADLSLEEEAAYLRIVNAINKHDAPVPNNDRVLAGMFRCSTRKARALLTALECAGKVYIEGGKITTDATFAVIRDDIRQAIPASVRRAVFGRDGMSCRYCGDSEGPFHLDHVTPWSRGGKDTEDNLVVSCKRCNWAKRDRTPEEMGWDL